MNEALNTLNVLNNPLGPDPRKWPRRVGRAGLARPVEPKRLPPGPQWPLYDGMGRGSIPRGQPRPSAPDVWLTVAPRGTEQPTLAATLPGQPLDAASEAVPASSAAQASEAPASEPDSGDGAPEKEKKLLWKPEGFWSYEEVREHSVDKYGVRLSTLWTT